MAYGNIGNIKPLLHCPYSHFSTVEVKPLMMAPFMAETTTSQLSGTKWYTVKYKGTAGY